MGGENKNSEENAEAESTQQPGGFDAWSDSQCRGYANFTYPELAHFCTGHRPALDNGPTNGRCYWDRYGTESAVGISAGIFGIWAILLFGFAAEAKMEKLCCCLKRESEE